MISVAFPDIGELERSYVAEAMESGWVSSIGSFLNRFESGFAEFVGTKSAVAVCNGTAALELALQSIQIPRGGEVIIPDLTFAAVGAAVVNTGGIPVLVDVDPDTMCLDPEAVAKALSRRTSAIVAVHSYGQPAEMESILAIAREHGLWVVEDCAEAHGAHYKGRPVGSLGDVGCFSFYGNKILTTGEGGMLVTGNSDIAERARLLRDHAMHPQRRYFHVEVGRNYRMTNLQAALGCAQIDRATEMLDRRARLLTDYKRALEQLPLAWPSEGDGSSAVNWMTTALLNKPADRSAIARYLYESGVDSRPLFEPLSTMPPYEQYRWVGVRPREMSVSADLASRGLSLPTSSLYGESEVAQVAEALRRSLAADVKSPFRSHAGGV